MWGGHGFRKGKFKLEGTGMKKILKSGYSHAIFAAATLFITPVYAFGQYGSCTSAQEGQVITVTKPIYVEFLCINGGLYPQRIRSFGTLCGRQLIVQELRWTYNRPSSPADKPTIHSTASRDFDTVTIPGGNCPSTVSTGLDVIGALNFPAACVILENRTTSTNHYFSTAPQLNYRETLFHVEEPRYEYCSDGKTKRGIDTESYDYTECTKLSGDRVNCLQISRLTENMQKR
jgi:hypothetical protein